VRLRRERDLLSTTERVAPPVLRGPLLVLAGAILWGTAGASQALLDGAVPPLAVGALRTVLGGIALVAVAFRTLGRVEAGTIPLRSQRTVLLLAGSSIAVYQVAFFIGVQALGIAVGTILAIGSAPFFAGAVAWSTGQGRPTLMWARNTLLAVVGLVLLVRPDGDAQVPLGGMVAALAAGLAFGAFTVMTKGLLGRGLRRIDAVAVPFGIAGVLLLPALAVGLAGAEDAFAVLRMPGLLVVAWLALGATAAGYLLFIAGLRGVTAVVGTTLVLAEPLTAALLGVLVFAERLDGVALVGAGLIAGALLLTAARSESGRAR